MAFLKDDEDSNQTLGLNKPNDNTKQDQANAADQVQLSTPSAVSSQDANANATGPQAIQANQPANPRASSGTFTNIKQYIDANKGNRIASATSQRLQTATNQAQRGVSDAQKQFSQRVDTGTLANRGQAIADINAAVNKAKNVTALPAVQPPVQAQPLSNEVTTPAPTQPVVQAAKQAPQYIDDVTKSRFADIINARYTGPESLRQAGLFDKASGQVSQAQALLNKTGNAQNRTSLLRDVFAQNRDYNRGQQGLDALLLNTDKSGVQRIQQQGKQAGDLQRSLESADTEAINLATNRANEVSNIRKQARDIFTGEQKGLETGIEKRIDDLIVTPAKDASGNLIPKLDATGKPMVDASGNPVYQTEWDRIPEYFKDVIRNKEANNKALIDKNVQDITANEINPIINSDAYKSALAAKNKLDQVTRQLQDAETNLAFSGGFTSPFDSTISSPGLSQQEIDNLNKQVAQLKQQQAALQAPAQQLAGFQNQINAANAKIAQEKQRSLKQLNLTPEEMAILGVSSGEGLYNLGQDAIAQAKAERDRLVTRDEQARLFALSQLAGLDLDKALKSDVLYNDLDKAGTQTLNSSLDTQKIRDVLNAEEQAFREMAQGANITGFGSKKNKTSGKRYYAEQSANLGDILKKAGYDFSKPLSTQVGNADIINASNTSRDQEGGLKGIAGAIEANKELVDPSGRSVLETAINLGLPLSGLTGALGLGSIGSAVTGALGFGGANSRASKADAKQFAIQDLQNKVQNAIAQSGFENRVNTTNDSLARARTEALKELLKRQG